MSKPLHLRHREWSKVKRQLTLSKVSPCQMDAGPASKSLPPYLVHTRQQAASCLLQTREWMEAGSRDQLPLHHLPCDECPVQWRPSPQPLGYPALAATRTAT